MREPDIPSRNIVYGHGRIDKNRIFSPKLDNDKNAAEKLSSDSNVSEPLLGLDILSTHESCSNQDSIIKVAGCPRGNMIRLTSSDQINNHDDCCRVCYFLWIFSIQNFWNILHKNGSFPDFQ
jgi:hypothetical protein